MLKISVEEVEHVALLSRLTLTEKEKQIYTETLNTILTYVDMLNQVDTSDVEPTVHVLPLRNVFREDRSEKGLDREETLANAPDHDDGCFRVPRIL